MINSCRSSQMVRSKEELKKQLLMGLERPSELIVNEESSSLYLCKNRIDKSKFEKSFSYSLLDEFSKCPIQREQTSSIETGILNNFMIGKNIKPRKPYVETVSASVQTVDRYFYENNETPLKRKGDSLSTMQFQGKTPLQAKEVEEDRSVIDVTNNLSNLKYPDSKQKNNSSNYKILTDSILEANPKENQFTKTKLQKQEVSPLEPGPFKQAVSQQNGPIVKKISLVKKSKSGNNQQKLKTQQPNQNQDDENEKLMRLLSKQSSIKSLIIKKKNQSSNNDSEEFRGSSKWQKKQRLSKKISDSKSEQSMINKSLEFESNDDPLDLFPPYESSSSERQLEAVIEEENEDLEESVRDKIVNGKKSIISASEQPKELQTVNEGKKEEQNIKSVSLSDLELDEVSEIQNTSDHKNFVNSMSLSQIPSPSQNSSHHSSKQKISNQKMNSKTNLERYVVNDIADDIQGLKRKIQSDFSNETDPKQTRNGKRESSAKDSSHGSSKQSKGDGSEGPGIKSNSMLDFIDQLNEELNLQDISKDINNLRDRMSNDFLK